MARKIKYGKIALAMSLTALIWVWADLALDEEYAITHTTISIASSVNPALWASFGNDEPSASIDKIVLKGPASRVADVKRKKEEGKLAIEFFLDPEGEKAMTTSGELDVLTFLRQSDQIRQLGLKVESCQPQTITVNIVELVKKSLTVKCIDEGRNLIKDTVIEPAKVDMFVPQDWQGEALMAKVSLTRSEIGQARLSPVEKLPYIELTAGRIRKVPMTVKITTPMEEDRLSDYNITAPALGFTFSPALQGKYKVEVDNLPELIRAITVRATPEAKSAYDNRRYQVILEIDDEDAKSTEPLRRELIYNFPAEYVRKDEIELKQQPITARFKLIPISDQTATTVGH